LTIKKIMASFWFDGHAPRRASAKPSASRFGARRSAESARQKPGYRR